MAPPSSKSQSPANSSNGNSSEKKQQPKTCIARRRRGGATGSLAFATLCEAWHSLRQRGLCVELAAHVCHEAFAREPSPLVIDKDCKKLSMSLFVEKFKSMLESCVVGGIMRQAVMYEMIDFWIGNVGHIREHPKLSRSICVKLQSCTA